MYRLLLTLVARAIPCSAMILCSCLTCVAQQAGLIDLTQGFPRRELRHPPARPGDPIKRTGAEYHYADCSLTSADPAIQTSVIAVDRNDYKEGDEQKFELRLANVGSSPAKIPFSKDLSDLQPADPGAKFTYFELMVQVWVIAGKAWSSNTGGFLALWI